jgi:hypothetical protein
MISIMSMPEIVASLSRDPVKRNIDQPTEYHPINWHLFFTVFRRPWPRTLHYENQNRDRRLRSE